jgi:hypothetical protein
MSISSVHREDTRCCVRWNTAAGPSVRKKVGADDERQVSRSKMCAISSKAVTHLKISRSEERLLLISSCTTSLFRPEAEGGLRSELVTLPCFRMCSCSSRSNAASAAPADGTACMCRRAVCYSIR